MENILEVLSQRRVWASLASIVALILPLTGYVSFDPETFVEAILSVINGIGALSAIILPIWSYLKPKSY